jgi:hypothetical protein
MVEDPELMSNPLSRDAILGFTAEPFPVEAFGGTVYVRPLSGDERDRYEASNLEQTRGGQTKLNIAQLRTARARLAQLCLVERDEQGRWRRMFTRHEIDKLGRLPAAELDKVTSAAAEASGLDSEREEELVESFDEETPAELGERSSSDLQHTSV